MSYLIYLTPFWAKEDACRFGKISKINHAIKNEGLIVILVSLTHQSKYSMTPSGSVMDVDFFRLLMLTLWYTHSTHPATY